MAVRRHHQHVLSCPIRIHLRQSWGPPMMLSASSTSKSASRAHAPSPVPLPDICCTCSSTKTGNFFTYSTFLSLISIRFLLVPPARIKLIYCFPNLCMHWPLLRFRTANSVSTTTSPATQIQHRLHEQLPPRARWRTPPPNAGTADQLSMVVARADNYAEDHVWFEDRWMVASLCDE
jgi:hypothetical protein